MREEFARFHRQRELEEQLRREWQLPEVSQILFSPSAEFALQEIARGFFSRYPHRMAIAVQDDIRPELETVIPALTREGVKVHRFQKGSPTDPLIAALGKLGLLIATATHDAVTGILYNFEPLLQRCAEAKIPVSCVTDHPSRVPENLRSGCCLVIPLAANCVVTLIGEKAGFEFFCNPHRRFVPDQKIDASASPQSELAVERFESHLANGLRAPLLGRKDRLWDRSVILSEGMDGSAWVEECSDLLGKNLFAEGVLVTSRCYWGDDLVLDWLKRAGWQDDQIRSLVVIPVELLEEIKPEIQASATRKIQQIQQGLSLT